MSEGSMKATADHATRDTRDLLRYIKDRADDGDLMMHLIAEHIQNLENKLKQYTDRNNVFA